MATTTTITSSYAGDKALPYVSAALFSCPTLDRGAITILPNVKYKQPLRPTSVTGLIADATCDFDPTATVTVTERILEPKYLQTNTEFCKADFQSTWDAIEMGYSAHDELPKTFSDFIIAEHIAQIAQNNEISIWRGDSDNGGEYDGFSKLLLADTGIPAEQVVAGTTIDASNVIDELGKIVDAMPIAVYNKPNKCIYVAQNIYRAYIRALGGFGAMGHGANGYENRGTNQSWGDVLFDGVPLFVTNGLANDTAVSTYKENFYFGTGLLSDHNEVKVIDMADIDGSQNVRFVMRMTGAVQYAISQDIVTYGLTS